MRKEERHDNDREKTLAGSPAFRSYEPRRRACTYCGVPVDLIYRFCAQHEPTAPRAYGGDVAAGLLASGETWLD